MTTILSIRDAAKYTFDAIEIAFKGDAAPAFSLHDVCREVASTTSGESSSPPVGLLMWFGEDRTDATFLANLDKLWRQNCRRFVLLAPDCIVSRPWDSFPPVQRGAISAIFSECRDVSLDGLNKAIWRCMELKTTEWMERHVTRMLEANTIQVDLLQGFGHAAQHDLSNQFLAPARLLMLGMAASDAVSEQTIAGWQDIWAEFKTKVLSRLQTMNTSLGSELFAASEAITAWFDTAHGPTIIADLERAMALLTTCRVLSGGHTDSRNSSITDLDTREPVAPQATFKILVVDDHSRCWKPVFEATCKALPSVIFDYSTDAETTENHIPIHWGHYDLVILDVFIGSAKDGREILNKLRMDFGHLPVLLWTTSRDDEITSKASLANGILLKKTVTPAVLRDTILKWVEAGAAKKSFSLPNPFFNHVITNPTYRELARKCNEWCLTQLDSFHALDGDFFRYFADHAGRHILTVLELLEDVITPFLSGSSKELLSDDPKQRQFEIFSLYLAVLCHELGMFPMKQGMKRIGHYDVGRVENFSSLGRDYLGDVRLLHALRAMVLLQDAQGSYWSDERGKDFGNRLHSIKQSASPQISVADSVAVLVGYHARCLKSLDPKCFLNWKEAWDRRDEKGPCDVQQRFTQLCSSAVTLAKTESIFKQALDALAATLTDDAYRERLRKQCALLRFVDAIDISQSRNPAQFLILGWLRDTKNNVEYLKRQVCETVDIQTTETCARVNVTLNAPKPDDPFANIVHAALLAIHCKNLPSDFQFVSAPWNASSHASTKAIQKDIDKWTEKTWAVLMGADTTPDFVGHLQKIAVLEAQLPIRVSTKGREILAAISALSVAGEVLDEYDAIIDAKLTDQIKLGDITWKWTAGEVPNTLTILREGLAQYPAGQ